MIRLYCRGFLRLRWSLVAAAAYARDSSETISLVEEFISRPIASFDLSRSNFFYFTSVYRNEIVVSVWLNEHSRTERTYADVNFNSTRMNKKWKNHRCGINEELLIGYLQLREICFIRLPLPSFSFFSFFLLDGHDVSWQSRSHRPWRLALGRAQPSTTGRPSIARK